MTVLFALGFTVATAVKDWYHHQSWFEGWLAGRDAAKEELKDYVDERLNQ